jgi:hypothetical protein
VFIAAPIVLYAGKDRPPPPPAPADSTPAPRRRPAAASPVGG